MANTERLNPGRNVLVYLEQASIEELDRIAELNKQARAHIIRQAITREIGFLNRKKSRSFWGIE